ncbi:sugar phosphate isomerase/epimerase family protein [Microbacterium sp. 179-I 3D3 NHS]|uniref:sugar phosphate isomerase/epimerase family protein n=1 Tax=unclassified Microbacterium TaxID=2609290 RepID=UPI0039A2F9FF
MTQTMMLGLANAGIPRDDRAIDEELLREWSALGIRCIATGFFAPPNEVARRASSLRGRLADAGIAIAQYAGLNANLVHPDARRRAVTRHQVRDALELGRELAVGMIASGCGTTAEAPGRSFYAPDPRNHHPETVDRLIDELRLIAPMAEDAGVMYSIECHQLTTMGDPVTIRAVLDAVDSPAIVANFDPVNLLGSVGEVYGNALAMERMLDVVGPRYGPSCHVKDVVVADELVCRIDEAAPGEGLLDFTAFFAQAARLPGPTALIVEHLPADRRDEAIAFVVEQAHATGAVLT